MMLLSFTIVVLRLLHSGLCSIKKTRTICQGTQAVIPCSISSGTWNYKQKGKTSQIKMTFQLTNRTQIVSQTLPKSFEDLVKIQERNALAISSFQTQHNGYFICMNETHREIHQLVSVQCQIETCVGDNAIIVCGSMFGKQPFKELAWKHGKTTVLTANEDAQVTFENKKYNKVNLSPNIVGALVVDSIQYTKPQRFTCLTLDKPGVTPRRCTVTLTPKVCQDKITVTEGTNVSLSCPYYHLLRNHPLATKMVWTKASRIFATVGRHCHLTSHSGLVNVDGKITLHNVSVCDNGTLTCRVLAINDTELARHTVTLHVTPTLTDVSLAVGLGQDLKPFSVLVCFAWCLIAMLLLEFRNTSVF